MRFLFLFLALLTLPAWGDVYTVRVDSSIVNIPTAFGTGTNSLVLSGYPFATSIMVENQTASEIAINCSNSSTAAAPSGTSIHNIYVQANDAWVLDGAAVAGNCFIKTTAGAAVTSGIFVLTLIQ